MGQKPVKTGRASASAWMLEHAMPFNPATTQVHHAAGDHVMGRAIGIQRHQVRISAAPDSPTPMRQT